MMNKKEQSEIQRIEEEQKFNKMRQEQFQRMFAINYE